MYVGRDVILGVILILPIAFLALRVLLSVDEYYTLVGSLRAGDYARIVVALGVLAALGWGAWEAAEWFVAGGDRCG